MQFVTAAVVKKIHEHITVEFSGSSDPVFPPGIRSLDLLESAVARQHSGSSDWLKYADPIANAATLMYGLCNNHPFHNGNKRTALLAGLLHLDLNGRVLHRATNDQMYDLMLAVAKSAVSPETKRRGFKGRPSADQEVAAIATWLQEKSRRIELGERSINYGRLYDILQNFGFRLGDKKHNKVEILRKANFLGISAWKCILKIPCPGDSRTVSKNELKQFREALRLTEAHGIDSVAFYGEQILIDEHIRDNRTVLRRLAKT